MINTCVSCGDKWKVNILSHNVKLNLIDKKNINKHGQLFSICEDCSEDGNCYSVEK